MISISCAQGVRCRMSLGIVQNAMGWSLLTLATCDMSAGLQSQFFDSQG